MTINPDCAMLDCMLLGQLGEVFGAMRKFANCYWRISEEEIA
jgi:hypothetical protein